MATVLLMFGLVVGSAMAVELSDAVRTVPLNDKVIPLCLASNKSGRQTLITTPVPSVSAGGVKKKPRLWDSTRKLANATPARSTR